jgi:hypothetical protein
MRRLSALAACVFALVSCGCTPKEWVIVVENQTYRPCTVAFDVGPGHAVQTTEVKRGTHVVASGTGTLPLNRVVVTRGVDQTERAGPALGPGYTFVVTVAVNGDVTTRVSDR